MTTIAPPPTDISADEFFMTWLPGAYTTARAAVTGPVPDTAVVIALAGAGGGRWKLAVNGGELSVSNDASSEAHIVIAAPVAAWQTMVAQANALGAAPLPPALDLPPAAHAAIHAAKGRLSLRISGFPDGELGADLTLGGADAPAATISTDKDTIDGIRSGAVNAAQAFFGGKIMMTGDTAFAMQLSMALMTPR